MELASLKKACKIASHRGHGDGVLLIFDPSVEYLSNLSECTVKRPEDAKFAPKRTNQEKQLFIKPNGFACVSCAHSRGVCASCPNAPTCAVPGLLRCSRRRYGAWRKENGCELFFFN